EFALKADWNFFSVQLEPNDPDIETAIGPIKDNLRAIWAYEWNNDTQEYEWLTYFPGGPPGFNTLHELHSCRGYWVEMDEIDSLIVNGSFNTDPIPLGVGWNMVAYRSIETVEVLDAVGSIIDEVDSIWAYEWNKDTIEYEWLTYFPGGPPGFNTLKYMKPGKAYWIEIREACDW
ncbi:hypothetical protein KA005_45250, partial [bacterium]|nr:hypothetical protein [bacterium]